MSNGIEIGSGMLNQYGEDKLRVEEMQKCRWVEFSTKNGAPFTIYIPNDSPDFIPGLNDEALKIPFSRFQVGRKSKLIYDYSGTGLEGHWAALTPEEIKVQLDSLEQRAYRMMVDRAGKSKVHAFLDDRTKPISPLLLVAGREAFEVSLAIAKAGRRTFELLNYYHMPDGQVKNIDSPERRQRALGFTEYVYAAPRVIDWQVGPKENGVFSFSLQQQVEILGTSPITQEYGGLDAEREPGGRFKTLSQIGRFAGPFTVLARRQLYK